MNNDLRGLALDLCGIVEVELDLGGDSCVRLRDGWVPVDHHAAISNCHTPDVPGRQEDGSSIHDNVSALDSTKSCHFGDLRQKYPPNVTTLECGGGDLPVFEFKKIDSMEVHKNVTIFSRKTPGHFHPVSIPVFLLKKLTS